jgi:DNA repair protein RecO (recombination protein O)
MEQRASGIVLRLYPFTETSLIVHWLTAELGRIATVAKGARRPGSPFRGRLDLFHRADLSLARSRRSTLHTLREVVLRDPHIGLRRDLGYIQQGAYAAALIELTTETEAPLPELFTLFAGLLEALPQSSPRPATVFAFELKLLAELGLLPDLPKSSLTPDARAAAHGLLSGRWDALAGCALSPALGEELRRFLHGFLIYHLGRLPRGRRQALGAGVADCRPGAEEPREAS